MNGPLRANKCTWIVCCVVQAFCVNTAGQAHTADSWLLRNSCQIYYKCKICLRAHTHFITLGERKKKKASCVWFEYAFIHILHSVAHKEMQMRWIFKQSFTCESLQPKVSFSIQYQKSALLSKDNATCWEGKRQKSSANCFLLDVNPETRFQREKTVEDALPHKKCNQHSWSHTWQKTPAPLTSSSTILVNMILFHHNDSNWNSKPSLLPLVAKYTEWLLP